MANTGTVAERYTTALFALATEKGLLDAVAADLQQLASLEQSVPDFAAVLHSAIYTRSEQAKAVTALATKLNLTDLTRRFVGTLAQNRRLALLADVAARYTARLAASRGEHTAEVVSAAPLRPAQVEAVRQQLVAKLGGTVKLLLKIDADIIGGLVVKVGSRMMDHSVRSKLERIGFSMKGTH